MPSPRLSLLGPVRLMGADGGDVLGLGVKAQAALAYVATRPDRRASRARLADLLWDGGEPRHALRQMLLVLRRRLGDGAAQVIRADDAAVALAPGVSTDLAEFATCLAADRLEAACVLWRGPFCEGLDAGGAGFEEWLALERARLDDSAAAAFAALANLAAREGRIDLAVAAARRRAEIHPYDDGAQAELIALYRRRGWAGAARLAHRRCLILFDRELGVAPGPEVLAAARTPVVQQPLPLLPPMTAARRGAGRRWAAAGAALFLAASVVAYRVAVAPAPADAAPAAWVDASEWRADARPESGGMPLPEAIHRALAGDPAFAHLYPTGC